MSVFPGGEAMAEYSAQVLRWNADAIVRNRNRDSLFLMPNAKNDSLLFRAAVVAGILRILNQVQQNLDHLMAIDGDSRQRLLIVADKRDMVPFQGRLMHARGVFDQFDHILGCRD